MRAAVVTPALKSTAVVHTISPKQKTASKPSKSPKAAEKVRETAKPAKAKKTNGALSSAERRNYVEVAAYYIAQRRGFGGGSELEDWIQAELEVDRLLK